MIYTVTFNPSLDYIVSVNGFELGKTTVPIRNSYYLEEKESTFRLF